jgi:hypothetical protein
MKCKILHKNYIIFDSEKENKIIDIKIDENIFFIKYLTNERDKNDKDIYKLYYSIPLVNVLYTVNRNDTIEIILKD